MLTGSLAPVSNAETWTDIIEFLDDETGAAYFTEADSGTHPSDVTVKLRDPSSGETVLSGSLSGGELEIVADGAIEFTFSASAMSALCAKSYDVGCLYVADNFSRQIILGRLLVLKGL